MAEDRESTSYERLLAQSEDSRADRFVWKPGDVEGAAPAAPDNRCGMTDPTRNPVPVAATDSPYEVGTDEYVVWFWLRRLAHLRSYTERSGAVTDPDLHEDLRESDPDAALDALERLIALCHDMAEQLAIENEKHPNHNITRLLERGVSS